MIARDSVVFALDSFKGSIRAAAASTAVAEGWRSVRDDAIRVLPMADGGEGTLEAVEAALTDAVRVPVAVTGPDGAAVAASWLRIAAPEGGDGITAMVELAGTSGIELLGTRRLRALDASTRGFGEAVAHALSHHPTRLVLGVGGSASTDGGMGMLRALGARFFDSRGAEVPEGGRGLAALHSADLSGLPPAPPGGVKVLTDVTNPLTGARGAAAVFGPQKGATPAEVALLDAGLARLARVLGVDPGLPGSGAAGGTGLGLLAWGAQLVSGASEVARLIGLAEAIADGACVVTGEGAYDEQSAAGKVPAHVADLAVAAGTPAALIAGSIAPGAATASFVETRSLSVLAGSTEAAIGEPARWLRVAGAELARALG